jgi:LacI family transcriptional regulator
MSQRVTMEDIARRTGVSLATVSLVLRDKPGINDETRRRVLGAARELGYRRRPALGPATGPGVGQIGVIMKARAGDLPQANPFYGPILASIEAACRKSRVNLLVATVPVDVDNHPEALPRMLLEDQLDGIILVGAFVDRTIDQLLRRRGVAAVLADAYATGQSYDAVVSDNFRGAYEAVAHLIARGHRHIALVGTLPDAYPSVAERRRGYEQCLTDHGIAARYYGDSHLVTAEAEAATEQLLRRHPEVTALFCANDNLAIAALPIARSLGRRLPEELSVIGFDDIDMAAYVTPALTTMRVDKLGLGRLAVQLLVNRIEAPDAGPVTAVLRPTLVERGSVAAPSKEVM